MANLQSDPHGNLRICFTLPGVAQRIRVPAGLPDTKEQRRFLKRSVLPDLEREIAARDYTAIRRRFPDARALKGLNIMQGDASAHLTVTDLIDRVERDYIANKFSNATRFKSTAKHLYKWFEGSLAIDVTTERVNQFIDQRLAEGAANATINRALSALLRGFRLAVEAGLLTSIPVITKLKEDNARKGFFEEADFRAVLKRLPAFLAPLAEAAYLTGWRRGELISRCRHHVNLGDPGWLRLEPGETKNGDGRMFPLIPELREVLERQLGATREFELRTGRVVPWLFHKEGQPIGDFRKTWERALAEAQAAGEINTVYLFHDFRRTAVRNLERSGVPRSAAMKLTGHETESVFNRYAIVDEAELEEAGSLLSAFMQRRSDKVSPLLAHPKRRESKNPHE